jgi:di/tricarboxylate transporter
MGVAMFASMWISNVAAPVLCFSIIQVSNNYSTCTNTSLTFSSPSCVTCLPTPI